MIAVPFTTENCPENLDLSTCRVVFTYAGERFQLLGQDCRWSGSQQDLEAAREYIGYQEHLTFHIGRLTGPTRSVQAFYEVFGNVMTNRFAPDLYLAHLRLTTILECPLITAIGSMVSAQDMSIYDNIDGRYFDGRVDQRPR